MFVTVATAILMLLAGIGIFLVACQMMSSNLESASSEHLKALFSKIGKSKLLGVGIGALSTALIQSSGATTVMVIGFVNVGIMSLAQAATIIYGANIGTTITAQIVALGLSSGSGLSTTTIFAALAGVGAFICLFAKHDMWKKVGGIITGFGMLFVGLSMMSGSMEDFAQLDAVKQFPNAFDPLKDKLPAEIDQALDRAIALAKSEQEEELLAVCHKIEQYFNFPKPNELVKNAEIPGGMYTNMVAQLKQLKAEDILEKAMTLIPTVRLAAGLPPLVTPTSQIVGAQAVNCALDQRAGKAMYTNVSNQFVNLVKGEYGKTPVPVDPEFRLKIAGVREETPYDTSRYQMQPNPVLEDCGGVKLAENEKELLLLELFPLVAKTFLTNLKRERYQATQAVKQPEEAAPVAKKQPITGHVIAAPMPGRVLSVKVKPGDTVKRNQELLVLEAMKMENSIMADKPGVIKQVLVGDGESVGADAPLVEFE